MTEYELVDAFMNHVGLGMTFFMAFLSATSAFLVAAYLAGSELPVVLARIIVAIYSLASVFLIFSFQRIGNIMLDIREQMHGITEWHTAVYEQQWVIPSAVWLAVVVMSLVFVGSIWFFQHWQHPDRRAPNKAMESDA